jgi:hypothetical protein
LSNVVTFTNYVPIPRYDGIPWTQANIQEAVASTGPWVTLETVQLVPVDDDPSGPQPRNFTTELAQLTNGWYRIVFLDSSGDQQGPTSPIQVLDEVGPYIPSVADVGALIRSRTKDGSGNELGTFTNDTRPTSAQVRALINESVAQLTTRTGATIPAALHPALKHMVTINTAMFVELGYYPEQIRANKSVYPELYTLLHGADGEGGKLAAFLAEFEDLTAEEGGATAGTTDYYFPPPPNYVW